MTERHPDETIPPVPSEDTLPRIDVRQFTKPGTPSVMPPGHPDATMRFRKDAEGDETREYHPDIMQFVELLNREMYTLMGEDGFIRTGLKVRRLDKVLETWMITLFNPEAPDSALDELTMTLGQFERERQRPVVIHE